MATTTNYSWTTPDDTALVKDGAAAIRSLGTAIDTTVFTNAGAAVTKATVDAKGDLIAGTADNTVARLAVGANDTVLTADSTAATGLKWAVAAGGGMTLISTTTLTGSSVLLSSIPQTYKDLQIIVRNHKPVSDNRQIRMNFNNDTTANRHRSSVTLTDSEDQTFDATYSIITARNDNSVATGLSVVDIFDYTNATTWKIGQSLSFTVNSTNTTNFNCINYKFAYNQVDAITSLNFYLDTGDFTSGTILLYGVK
jgi:hypothetical protein